MQEMYKGNQYPEDEHIFGMAVSLTSNDRRRIEAAN